MGTRRCDTDLTDEQFALIEPHLPRRKATGRPPADLRAVLNGILYLVRTGCQWRRLPKDFPPWSTVHTWYRRWRRDGTWGRLNEALRRRARPPLAARGALERRAPRARRPSGRPPPQPAVAGRRQPVGQDHAAGRRA